MTLKLAILISGRGSNMVALADYAVQDEVDCKIVAVIADGEAAGLTIAAERGLNAICINRQDYSDKAAHEEAVISAIDHAGADAVFLAGYMRLLSAAFCNYYQDKLFNIHPSLLPRHKGLDTHERAIAAGDNRHGCSVHLVTEDMDDGLVLAQRDVPVLADDTPDSLAARVLVQEHQLYPALLGALSSGLLAIHDGAPEMKIGILPGLIAGEKRQWPV